MKWKLKIEMRHDWHRDDVPGVIGTYRLTEYLTEDFQKAGHAGEAFAVHDTATDPRTSAEKYAALKIGSFLCVPLVRDGRWRFLLCIYHSIAHHWREDEIDLMRQLTARIWTRLERARADGALRASERETKRARDYAEATLRSSPVPLLVLEKDLRVNTANEAFYQAFNVAPAETDGRLIYELGNGQWNIPKLRELLEDILPSRTTFHQFEVTHEFEAIGHRTMLLNARRMENESGSPERIVLVFEDITARKQTEDALREALAKQKEARAEADAARAHFRSLFESGPGLYLVLKPDTLEIVGASEAYLRATMTERSQIVGKGLFEVFPDDPNEPSADGTRNLRASLTRVQRERCDDVMAVQRYPVRLPQSQGGGFEERYWSPTNSPILDPSGHLAFIIHRAEDVTAYVRLKQQEGAWDENRPVDTQFERMEAEIVVRSQELKRAEQALRKSQERFDIVRDGAQVGFWFCDLPFDKLVWDNRVKEHFWLSPDATVTIDTFYECLHPDDRERTRAAIAASIANRERYDIEYRTVSAADGGEKWIRAIGRTFYDADGQAIRFDGVTLDITENMRAEEQLRASQAKLAEANEQLTSSSKQLESLVQQRTAKLTEIIGDLEGFSYSITHDLRAPLRAVNSFSHMLAEEHGAKLDEDGKRLLHRIQQSVTRMDKLIQDVLQYSQVLRAELKLEPINTDWLVRGMLDSYPDFQEPKATVRIEGQLPEVLANEAALLQCFSNLLNNAVKFVSTGTKPQVTIRAVNENSKVRFWIEDNGIGIEPKYLENIFALFQRLTNEYEGTGVGLSVVRKAVERMGGAVGAESGPGQGSRFWFELKSANSENENR